MVPVSDYTTSEKVANCVSVIGGVNKKMFSVTLNGKFLPMQLTYSGKTEVSPQNGYPGVFPRHS